MKVARVMYGVGVAMIMLTACVAADEEKHARGLNHVFITGKSGCSKCDGAGDKHDLMLTTKGGIRFVLKGEGSQYATVHKIRNKGKTITVRLVGRIVEKTGSDKRTYLECKVRDIAVKDKSVDLPTGQ